jgi:hypothetical protein
MTQFTHDHRGRKLSPALKELLNSTVIPRPKIIKNKHKFKNPDTCQHEQSPNTNPFKFSFNYNSLPVLSPSSSPSSSCSSLSERESIDHNSLSWSTINDDNTQNFDFNSANQWDNWLQGEYSSNDDEYYQTNVTESSRSPSPAQSFRRRKLELPIEEATDNHPLAPTTPDDILTNASSSSENSNKKHTKTSFVSNLTASFKALTTSLSTLQQNRINQHQNNNSTTSNKTTNNNNGNNYLFFAFSPRLTDDPIPILWQSNKPDLQQPSDEEQQQDVETYEIIPRSVSLKTYSVQATLNPHLRPREIRMNPDFYRIYAMETLMRVNGKLNPAFEGRARMLLEPRKDIGRHYLNVIERNDLEADVFYGIRKRFVSAYDRSNRSLNKNSSVNKRNNRWVSMNASEL